MAEEISREKGIQAGNNEVAVVVKNISTIQEKLLCAGTIGNCFLGGSTQKLINARL